MEKRAFKRVPAHLPVKYTCDNIQYSGTAKNISENGMFIRTNNFLPCDNTVEIIVPLKEQISRISASIRRIEKKTSTDFAVGVELINPSDSYIKYVRNLSSSSEKEISG
jgi:c-di-GMP-binding flagellar brake protein YcgR